MAARIFQVSAILCILVQCALSAQYDSENRRLILKIEDKETTNQQYYSSNAKNQAYRYGYDIGKTRNFHHETRGPDGVTYGCYGYVDEAQKLHVTFYVSDTHAYRTVLPQKNVTVFPMLKQNELRQWHELYFPSDCGKFEGGSFSHFPLFEVDETPKRPVYEFTKLPKPPVTGGIGLFDNNKGHDNDHHNHHGSHSEPKGHTALHPGGNYGDYRPPHNGGNHHRPQNPGNGNHGTPNVINGGPTGPPLHPRPPFVPTSGSPPKTSRPPFGGSNIPTTISHIGNGSPPETTTIYEHTTVGGDFPEIIPIFEVDEPNNGNHVVSGDTPKVPVPPHGGVISGGPPRPPNQFGKPPVPEYNESHVVSGTPPKYGIHSVVPPKKPEINFGNPSTAPPHGGPPRPPNSFGKPPGPEYNVPHVVSGGPPKKDNHFGIPHQEHETHFGSPPTNGGVISGGPTRPPSNSGKPTGPQYGSVISGGPPSVPSNSEIPPGPEYGSVISGGPPRPPNNSGKPPGPEYTVPLVVSGGPPKDDNQFGIPHQEHETHFGSPPTNGGVISGGPTRPPSNSGKPIGPGSVISGGPPSFPNNSEIPPGPEYGSVISGGPPRPPNNSGKPPGPEYNVPHVVSGGPPKQDNHVGIPHQEHETHFGSPPTNGGVISGGPTRPPSNSGKPPGPQYGSIISGGPPRPPTQFGKPPVPKYNESHVVSGTPPNDGTQSSTPPNHPEINFGNPPTPPPFSGIISGGPPRPPSNSGKPPGPEYDVITSTPPKHDTHYGIPPQDHETHIGGPPTGPLNGGIISGGPPYTTNNIGSGGKPPGTDDQHLSNPPKVTRPPNKFGRPSEPIPAGPPVQFGSPPKKPSAPLHNTPETYPTPPLAPIETYVENPTLPSPPQYPSTSGSPPKLLERPIHGTSIGSGGPPDSTPILETVVETAVPTKSPPDYNTNTGGTPPYHVPYVESGSPTKSPVPPKVIYDGSPPNTGSHVGSGNPPKSTAPPNHDSTPTKAPPSHGSNGGNYPIPPVPHLDRPNIVTGGHTEPPYIVNEGPTKHTTTTGSSVPNITPRPVSPFTPITSSPHDSEKSNSCPCTGGGTSSNNSHSSLTNNKYPLTSLVDFTGPANYCSAAKSTRVIKELPVWPLVDGHPSSYPPEKMPKGAVIALMPVIILPEADCN